MSPDMMFWDLMMKNVYSLGAYSVQKEKFRLNVTYQSDSTGTYVNYLPEGNCANQILIRVLGLDRLDTYDNQNPDGFFDLLTVIRYRRRPVRLYSLVYNLSARNYGKR